MSTWVCNRLMRKWSTFGIDLRWWLWWLLHGRRIWTLCNHGIIDHLHLFCHLACLIVFHLFLIIDLHLLRLSGLWFGSFLIGVYLSCSCNLLTLLTNMLWLYFLRCLLESLNSCFHILCRLLIVLYQIIECKECLVCFVHLLTSLTDSFWRRLLFLSFFLWKSFG
jgi:hypothetical protein